MIERRKYPRIRARNRISVIARAENQEKVGRSQADWLYTVDISKGGLRFATDRRMKKNERLRIDMIRRNPGESISLCGVVRWVQHVDDSAEYHVGVEFVEGDDRSLKAWHEHVERKLEAAEDDAA